MVEFNLYIYLPATLGILYNRTSPKSGMTVGKDVSVKRCGA